MDAAGIDMVERMILQGVSVRTMAQTLDVSMDAIVAWTSAPERSARVWEARQKCATMWEERAEEVMQQACGEHAALAISRAKELAHHYRWRAAALRKDRYGPQAPTVTTTINLMTPELQAARSRLVADLDTLAQPEPLTIEGRAEPAEAPDRWE
jgi:hypothetical protein